MSDWFKKFKVKASKKSPEIMMVTGLTAIFGAGIVSVWKVTPKYLLAVEKRKHELHVDKLPVKEVAILIAKYYGISIGVALAGATCIVLADREHEKRNAALTAACALSETALIDMKEAIKEEVGEKQLEQIEDKMVEERIIQNPVTANNVYHTGHGDTLFYDYYCDRYFYASPEWVRKAFNDINSQINDEMYASVNDLYYHIGLKQTELGEQLGWNKKTYLLKKTMLSDDDRPCCVLIADERPKSDFKNFWSA